MLKELKDLKGGATSFSKIEIPPKDVEV